MPAQMSVPDPAIPADSPFRLDAPEAYRRWRDARLAARPELAELIVPLGDPAAPTAAERAAILDRCRRANLAVYDLGGRAVDRAALRALGRQFGLQRLDGNLCAEDDGVTALAVSADGSKRHYIPYTNRRLSWHTDGYYNPPGQRIRAFILHCVRPAAQGGESLLLDHELAYIALRDQDPALIEALMRPDAMTIPPNEVEGRQLRGTASGPVFSVDRQDGSLHMRYSARTRNIQWRDDPLTRAAAQALQALWAEGSPWIYRLRLKAGQGVICNNVLHCRTAFEDGAAPERQRLLYRARYYDRIRDLSLPAGET
ncbi:TauD/TfdA family dioxygenase [Thiohalobacter sp. IOR34]|uniref:TauD/TfdA family dioxygenase n=1 Tax=Thiohalobacter sp. IOR34 TaxID=3057176 RepID=UPI0025B038D5|nr:TauD/TfdA family dioxygenase [Thiohalobacter sp. IOR34]WJW74341.1 TauD/TfdA family dioxygenase [Thiohalobacter sp. IOR34]